MRSPVRTSREQVDKENKPPKNIGELSPIVRAKLKHQESGQQQSSTSTHTPLQNRDKYEHLKPLSSTRDPRRRKLQSHLPFAPFSHGVYYDQNESRKRKKSKKKIKRQKRKQNHIDNTIAPAYAFRNAETGNLHITFQPPASKDVALVETGDGSASFTPALYPISINGGGIGVYNDPRHFAKGGINTMSQNIHETTNAPTRSFVSFPWNMGNGTFSDEKRKQMKNMDENDSYDDEAFENYIDLEAGLHEALDQHSNENEDSNHWKTWERIHNKVVKVRERLSLGISLDYFEPPKRVGRLSCVYNDDDYDYAIVLQPKEVYAFWAGILDFREENGYSTQREGEDAYSTPAFGSRKRRRQGHSKTPGSEVYSNHKNVSVNENGDRIFLQPGNSLFDRAMAKATPSKSSHKKNSPIRSFATMIRNSISNRVLSPNDDPPSSSAARRRWGNNVMSPPIRAFRKKSPKRGNRYGGTPHPFAKSVDGDLDKGRDRKRRKKNSNRLEIEDIPTERVPRGIALRTNGLNDFLWALNPEQGIVVRRHIPGHDPVFVKLTTSDAGDTIQFNYISPQDAFIALKAQKIRYNMAKLRGIDDDHNCDQDASHWWEECTKVRMSNEEREQHNYSLHAHNNRISIGNDVKKSLDDFLYRGSFKVKYMVAVKKANEIDPLSGGDEKGTPTLRETMNIIARKFQKSLRDDMTGKEKEALVKKTLFKQPKFCNTFSIVLPGRGVMIGGTSTIKTVREEFAQGNNADKNFRYKYLDFETATPGEFWMLFRGFLKIYRDASHSRFATDRAKGFGSSCNRQEPEGADDHKSDKKLVSFHEPKEQSFFNRLLCAKNRTEPDSHIEHYTPPPSDYFLGFKSHGTQIWSRLRQAGLETKRIYDLDKKIVMIKIRCPSDRLMDVAEVLRLKLKTIDGYYQPFQESIIHQFQNDRNTESYRRYSSSSSSIFPSSMKQHIIDFIINSSIRDSGASLSGQDELGKSIKLRVPMHSHARLEELYKVWVHYYKKENWIGDSPTIDVDRHNLPIPSLVMRLWKGCLHQPLDSIEQYFGERVAFKFAWLEHCSRHLVSISILGLIVFVCQMSAGSFDHVLRPYFSVILMLWSFYVLAKWRQRQNYLAHRWGTLNYKQEETMRPQFRGEERKCTTTDESIIYYPSWKRWLKYCISIPITVAFTVVSLLGFLIVHANRDLALARYLNRHNEDNDRSVYDFNWSLSVIGEIEAIGAVTLSQENLRDFRFWYIVAGLPCALGLSLPLLNFILMQLSRRLNEFENHKTVSQYLNALITKVIAFRFVTYFSALYYYAYISTGKDNQTVENSILRVATSLIIYLTVSQWWGIILGIYVPLLMFRWRLFRKAINLGKEVREIEALESKLTSNKQSLDKEELEKLEMNKANRTILLEQANCKVWEEIMLPDYDPFYDYILAVVFFAFVTCFSAMLPLTPLLVLMNQMVNMRLYAYKICRSRRRPLSQKSGGVSAIH